MAKTSDANSFDRPTAGFKGPVGDYDGSKEFNNEIYGQQNVQRKKYMVRLADG